MSGEATIRMQPTIDIQETYTLCKAQKPKFELRFKFQLKDFSTPLEEQDDEQEATSSEEVGQQEKPARKLSRGASIKSLFGVGPKVPKSTPCSTPKVQPSSGSATPKSVCESISPGHGTAQKQFLQVGNTSSIFRLPKPQVKLLKKTSSVKQLYNSVLHALKTIASARDDIVPELTKTFFENILRASDESPKLVVTKVKVDDSKEFGRHFCSEVHAVEVTAKIKDECGHSSHDEDKTVTYHLIVKSQPQNENARKFLQPGQTFEKEVQMYGQVFHDMANFVRKQSQVCVNCLDSEVIDVPRCFYTRWAGENNVKEDLIILENLYPKGFTFAVGQDDALDRSHSELVIRELAKFHAISYCMKQGKNEFILSKYPYLVEDSLYRPSTEGFTKRTITPVMATLAELIRNTPDYEEHYEWFIELARNFHQIQMEMVRPKNNFAVICHGDLWPSNILFRYSFSPDQPASPIPPLFEASNSPHKQGHRNGRPVEVKFLDFQSARFSSLATDLILFLFTSVRTDLRRMMLGELVSLYYTTFLVSVRSLNISEELFSMEELFIEVENYIIYGFLEGIWYLDIVHGGNTPKANQNQDMATMDNSDEDYAAQVNAAKDEDELEKAQVYQLEKRMEPSESLEQKNYREEFFELLDEVLFLLGKPSTEASIQRRKLRDTSFRFHRRLSNTPDPMTSSSSNGTNSSNPHQ